MLGAHIRLIISLVIAYYAYKYYIRSEKKLKGGVLGPWDLVVILLAPVFVFVLMGLVPFHYLEPYKGKVVDEDTNEPITGAAVLVIYRYSYPSLVGTLGGVEDVKETKTDSNGYFHLKATWRLTLFDGGSPEGWVIVFKPGYEAEQKGFMNFANTYLFGEYGRLLNPPYFVYKLNKIEERKERLENLRSLPKGFMEYGVAAENMKYYLLQINEEYRNLGLDLMDISTPEVTSK